MSERYMDNLLPDFGEYSLDSFLDSYRQRAGADEAAGSPEQDPEQPVRTAEAIAQRSRQIVMEALGETLSSSRKAPEVDFGPEDLHGPAASAADGAPDGADKPAPPPEEAPKKSRVSVSPDGVITLNIDMPQPEPEEYGEDDRDEEDPGSAPVESLYEQDEEDEDQAPRRGLRGLRARRAAAARAAREEEKPSAKEQFLMPFIRLVATRIARRQMQKAEAANWPDPVEFRETDELEPKKGAKFYYHQLKALRFRLRICVFLCLILAWISLQMPMAGMLGRSLAVQSGVSLVLLLTVMMASLDILAAGIRQLFDLRPGAEALACLSALMSCADAVMVMLGYGAYMPFCAVGGVSLTCALWGEQLGCRARGRTLRMAALSKAPSAMTAEETGKGSKYVCRSARPVEGVTRRCEQPDFCQTTYATASPILLGLSLALAAGSSVGGQGSYFLHTLSALLAVSASFTAFLSFPLPYSLTAKKLQPSGAAVVGWPGCADIGKSRRVVISDNDLFPPGTIKFSGINILEGALVDKVVSCTASLLAASGSGVTGLFMELITRRGYATVRADEFRCHEGGGLSARVNGEQVLVGTPGFMNLMGIRLPRNMVALNAVCTAISGELMGVFTLEYTPVGSVQDALVTLLQGRTQPVFAIRDFNITPLMIRQLFRMPTDNFNFPTFRDRYRIAASAAGINSPVAAVLSRPGMGPLVDAAEAGRKLYGVCRVGTVISLVGTAIGMLTMFLLFRAGSYDTATAGNVLSYMFLWALPVGLLAYGQTR